MAHFGNDEAGFSVWLDDPTRTVRVKAWGFWTPEVAAEFARSVTEACRSVQNANLSMDLTGLKPQREEGQAAFAAMMGALPRLGLSRASIQGANPLTKLQLLRIAKERAVRNLVHFTGEP